MTMQAITLAGKGLGVAPTGQAKTRGDQAGLDPGFASLLAAMFGAGPQQLPDLTALVAAAGQQLPEGIDPAALLAGEGLLQAGQLTNPLLAAMAPVLPQQTAQTGPFDQALAGAVEQQVPGLPLPEALPQTGTADGTVAPTPQQMLVEVMRTPLATDAEATLPDEPLPTPMVEADLPGLLAPVKPEAAKGQGMGTGQHPADQQPDFVPAPQREAGRTQEHEALAGIPAERFTIAHTNHPAAVEQAAPPQSTLPPSLESLRAHRFEPPQLMESISQAVKSTDDGQYTVTLRLHPEQLGEVRLQLQVSGREVHTVMQVASSEARQALESRGDQLRQHLDQAGLTLSSFEVSTGQQQRETARERRDALAEQFRSQSQPGGRREQTPISSPAGAIERIRNAGRRSGRFDTMA